MICLALIILISGWKLFTIVREYNRGRDAYDAISEQALTQDGAPGVDFDALRRINPEVAGWIRYDAAHIDYPVVRGSDNDKYLYTMFDGRSGGCGTLFIDADISEPFRQFSTIIYGHHMRDGSMFGSLKKLRDPSFCEENPRMKLYTPDENYDLEIWAFLNQPADSDLYDLYMSTEEERAEYIEMVRGLASYTTDISVTPSDRLVILSTCAYEYKNARYVVICKMVPEQ